MRTVELPAEPAAISIDLDRTALIVVDMQNAFASSGGLLDLAGIDVRPARDAIANADSTAPTWIQSFAAVGYEIF